MTFRGVPSGLEVLNVKVPFQPMMLAMFCASSENRHVLSGADVQEHLAGIILHDEDTSVAKSSEKRNSRFGVPLPHNSTVGELASFGRMDLDDQRSDNVAAFGIVTVSRTVQIGRHH